MPCGPRWEAHRTHLVNSSGVWIWANVLGLVLCLGFLPHLRSHGNRRDSWAFLRWLCSRTGPLSLSSRFYTEV